VAGGFQCGGVLAELHGQEWGDGLGALGELHAGQFSGFALVRAVKGSMA
jgi:hypothetical protein